MLHLLRMPIPIPILLPRLVVVAAVMLPPLLRLQLLVLLASGGVPVQTKVESGQAQPVHR